MLSIQEAKCHAENDCENSWTIIAADENGENERPLFTVMRSDCGDMEDDEWGELVGAMADSINRLLNDVDPEIVALLDSIEPE